MLILRCAALGLASGLRSSLAVAAPVLSGSPGRLARLGATLAVAGELVGDKLPATPSRLDPPILQARILAGGIGAASLARRGGIGWWAPIAVGLAGSAVGNVAGARWRRWAAERPIPDLAAAVIEDAIALGLAAWACAPAPENLAHSSSSPASLGALQ